MAKGDLGKKLAFPQTNDSAHLGSGMTLREYYIGQALTNPNIETAYARCIIATVDKLIEQIEGEDENKN
jgi:hypothetical protein